MGMACFTSNLHCLIQQNMSTWVGQTKPWLHQSALTTPKPIKVMKNHEHNHHCAIPMKFTCLGLLLWWLLYCWKKQHYTIPNLIANFKHTCANFIIQDPSIFLEERSLMDMSEGYFNYFLPFRFIWYCVYIFCDFWVSLSEAVLSLDFSNAK